MKLNYSYAYDSNNFLHSLTDHIADQVTVYTYDTYGNPDRTYTYDSETYKNLYEVNVAVSPTENRMEFVLERLDYTHTAGFGTAETTFDFFFYEKNLQGDIIGIFNTNGRRVGWYIYDAWGACTTTVASSTSTLEQSIVRSYNPYRYRGYYYDVESSLYYLQSRYYNPAWGRFLNADGIACLGASEELLSYNLFSYCSNNPIMNIDPLGTFSWGKFALAVVGVVAVTALCVATAGTFAAAAGVSVVAVKAATATACMIAAGVSMADQYVEEKEISDPLEVITETATAGGESILGLNAYALASYKTLDAAVSTISDSIKDSKKGMKLDDALARNSQEQMIEVGVKEAIDYAFAPNTYDICTNIARILFGNKEEE